MPLSIHREIASARTRSHDPHSALLGFGDSDCFAFTSIVLRPNSLGRTESLADRRAVAQRVGELSH